MKVLIGLSIWIISLHASAQIQSGTTIVLMSTKDEIVVTADSRAFNASIDLDDSCKITALGNRLLIAATGEAFARNSDERLAWDAHTIGRNVFDEISKEESGEPLAVRVANAWGNKIKEKLQNDLNINPNEVLLGAKSNSLAHILVAGFDHDKPVWVAGQITYRVNPAGVYEAGYSVLHISTTSGDVALGYTDIANEFLADKTPRAIRWRNNLHGNPGDDPIAVGLIEAVRLAIKYTPPIHYGNRTLYPVGGPIDAVRLSRSNGIQWIQRKPNCPKN